MTESFRRIIIVIFWGRVGISEFDNTDNRYIHAYTYIHTYIHTGTEGGWPHCVNHQMAALGYRFSRTNF